MSLFVVEANFFSKRRSTFYVMLASFYVLVSLFNIGYVTGEQCIVTAPAGTFRGVSTQSRSVLSPGFGLCNYYGIPYAQPPVGNLRFARPVPAAPIRGGIYNATTDGSACPQLDITTFQMSGSEDCLFLNVYVPQMQCGYSQKLLPVMVFYHGSGYLVGSSSSTTYGPDNLVPKGVVLVTFNYRLNIYGFLNLEEPTCSGNMGLADGILALQWVQQNIRSFGGDPNAVTLFGESAGAQCVYLLTISPLARGLFGKACIESTVLTTESYIVRDPEQVVNSSIQFAQTVGYQGNPDDHAAILSYLRSIPANQLTPPYFYLTFQLFTLNDPNGFYHTHGAPLIPCRDYYVGNNAILPASFEEMGKRVPPIPILIGYLDRDSSVDLILGTSIVDYVKANLTFYLREANPIFVNDQETQDEIVPQVLARYYNPNNNDNEIDETLKLLNIIQYYNFYKLISFLRASYVTGNIRIFEFIFADGGPYDVAFRNSQSATLASQIRGALHGEELIYLFYASEILNGTLPNANERKVLYEMCTWWTNFAKTGNPNSVFDDIRVVWDPSTPSQNKYLEINNQTRLVNTKIDQEDRDFFARLLNSMIYNRGRQNTVTAVPYEPYFPVNYLTFVGDGVSLGISGL